MEKYQNMIIILQLSKDELLEICNGKIEEDFAYTDSKNQRYRVNSFLTRGKLALVIRIINKEPIKLKGKFINKLIDEKIFIFKRWFSFSNWNYRKWEINNSC